MRSLALADLAAAYRSRQTTPLEVVMGVLARADAAADRNIWIARVPRERLLAQARALSAQEPRALPLYGIPFAIKDNIDLAGLPTTAACPAFAYTPERSAPIVERLIEAGAIALGKTNLDQFATGLLGTRSPYGVCRNAFDPAFISGGSSSGSALAVALGQASFSLGTDTAGSGRVPAAFNNLVGYKPTVGRVSARGVVPACRTLDVVSTFAVNAQDAARVASIIEGFDAAEPYSRRIPVPHGLQAGAGGGAFDFGVPCPSQLEFFGNAGYARLFASAVGRLESLGGRRVEIDLEPFTEAARLLYEGPWVAERLLVIESLLRQDPDAILPVTRAIIAGAASSTAADAFRAQYRLQALRRATEPVWQQIGVLVTPTAGTIYRLAEIEAEPVRRNSDLGHYTNFANLLDLAAVSVPAGFDERGLPFGVMLSGPAWSDARLLALAARLQYAAPTGQGATGLPLPDEAPAATDEPGAAGAFAATDVTLAVCGAHMQGLALNAELRRLGASFLERTRTSPRYRLYALPGGPPQRPGLVRDEGAGQAIEVELWALSAAAFGAFVAHIPPPLGIGKIELADRRRVSGFLCEFHALQGALEISHHGGWRAYLAARGASGSASNAAC
jgi:allophanate hydrolase